MTTARIIISSDVHRECVLSATTLGFSAGKVLVLPADAAGLHSGQHCERAWSRWVLHVSGIAKREWGQRTMISTKRRGSCCPLRARRTQSGAQGFTGTGMMSPWLMVLLNGRLQQQCLGKASRARAPSRGESTDQAS